MTLSRPANPLPGAPASTSVSSRTRSAPTPAGIRGTSPWTPMIATSTTPAAVNRTASVAVTTRTDSRTPGWGSWNAATAPASPPVSCAVLARRAAPRTAPA